MSTSISKLFVAFALGATIMAVIAACKPEAPKDADTRQRREQEIMLAEATSQTGMPNIKNFRERKLLKEILELRDQDGLVTYTYLVGDDQAKLVFFCHSIGFGIPYATQYTNPEKPVMRRGEDGGNLTLPNADPNALFSPASAEGTWIMCKDPNSANIGVVYVEPRIVVSSFPLEAAPPEAPASSGKSAKP